jgi:hypothetical protein
MGFHHTGRTAPRVLGLAAGSLLLLSGIACATTAGTPTVQPVPVRSASPASTTASTPVVHTRQPHILVFTATGTATLDSVTYVVDGRSATVPGAALPWRVSVDVPADGAMHNYSVTVLSHHGSVDILAIQDGTVTGSSTGDSSGSGTVQLGGSLAG